MTDKWGFCMAGNEETFLQMIDRSEVKGEPIVYYEIGLGHGDTICRVNEHIGSREAYIVGVDVPGWKPNYPMPGAININLEGSGTFLKNAPMRANYIFIDGCHGSPCVTSDFLLAEKIVRVGGIICFHDTDPNCQGHHFQDHCNMSIDVRAALEKLGLLDDSRPGWKKIGETMGKFPEAHGCVWVQKLA
jgi:hypothetical protein